MELILKETIDTLGQEGDVVKVKPGYARNYLIPQKLAVIANKETLTRLEQDRAVIDARKTKQRQADEVLFKALAGTTVTIKQRVGDEQKLFGSVTSGDIAQKLAELDIRIDKKKIMLPEPIKTIGETVVNVKVGYQMNAEIKVVVVPLESE